MKYAGEVIKRWIRAKHRSPYQLSDDFPIAPKPPTTYKILKGQYAADDAVTLRLETALGWPSGTVARLAVQDFAGMTAIGAPAELVRVAREMAPPPPRKRSSALSA